MTTPEPKDDAVGAGATVPPLLIRGGRVYRHDGDINDPAIRDILIQGSRIVSVTAPDEDAALKQEIMRRATDANEAQVIDARGKLVLPGFVNAHYHSYDVLAKGLLEDMPFDVWALHSQPAYFGRRSKQEIRVRTLLGALECLQNGVTTVQDMNSLVPQDEETLDAILSAYEEIGIRVVFSIAVRDVGALDIAPFLPPDVPESVMTLVRGVSKDAREEIAFRRAPDQTSGALAAARDLGPEPLRTAAFLAHPVGGRR
jgi:5-methylthioadenosine/S-adenosylhomocysteine deaminase